MISIYVNDVIFYEPDQTKIASLIKELEKEFRIINLEDATWLLDIYIEYHADDITLS